MKLKILIAALFVSILLTGCGQDEERVDGLMNIFLIDAPGDFDQAWVEVLGAEIVVNGTTHFLEYVTADKKVNVSALVADNSLLVGRKKVPAGQMTEVILILGEELYVIRAGQRTNMQYLTADSRRFTFPVDFTIDGGNSYDYYVDLDMSRSVRRAANEFVFDPIGRAFSSRGMGILSGTILPAQAAPYIYAIQDGDTVGTMTNFANGQFYFRGLNAGDYQLLIQPRSGFADTLINIPIRTDTVNQIGNIDLRVLGP
ncbi:DUF4382 domain-containing protein [Litoribacter populi]|uniref:DUF4382 domain-containing protein n=1 Tax=Litoribacter populi TaxID=2598460 RepID=UPI00117CECA8|nr:DUF4382 domain-containing protein [Litoribacter populi]